MPNQTDPDLQNLLKEFERNLKAGLNPEARAEHVREKAKWSGWAVRMDRSALDEKRDISKRQAAQFARFELGERADTAKASAPRAAQFSLSGSIASANQIQGFADMVDASGYSLARAEIKPDGSYHLKADALDREANLEIRARDGKLLYRDPKAITTKDFGFERRDYRLNLYGEIDPENPDEPRFMPDLIKTREEEALSALAAMGREPVIKREESDVDKGLVIGQSPEAGAKIDDISEIILVISEGMKAPEPAKMPDLRGKSLMDAREALAEFLYASLTVNYKISEESEGMILDQSPEAGAELSAEMAIVLTAAQKSVVMPDLQGASKDEAQDALKPLPFAHLSFVEKEVEDQNAIGKIVAQEPEAGQALSHNVVITLAIGIEVKKDEAPEKISLVPDLLHMNKKAVRKAVKDAGITAFEIKETRIGDKALNGLVVEQEPKAGARLADGAALIVAVGVYKE